MRAIATFASTRQNRHVLLAPLLPPNPHPLPYFFLQLSFQNLFRRLLYLLPSQKNQIRFRWRHSSSQHLHFDDLSDPVFLLGVVCFLQSYEDWFVFRQCRKKFKKYYIGAQRYHSYGTSQKNAYIFI